MAGLWLDVVLFACLMALLYAAAWPERIFAARRNAGRRRGAGQAAQRTGRRLTRFYRRFARQAGVEAGARHRDLA